MNTLKQQLDSALEKWNLLNHPFYTAWSCGMLPAEKLKQYSGEYGTFIQLIAKGWDACADAEIANEEREHFELWKQFASSLGVQTIHADVSEVKNLTSICEEEFTSYESSLGSLYAFEAQQPNTAKSKLKGLREHYSHLHADETYFSIHENDVEEPALLLSKMEKLDLEKQQIAVASCEKTSEALWNALTGIMN
jgi:pyrroloquinoline-quinone synthase